MFLWVCSWSKIHMLGLFKTNVTIRTFCENFILVLKTMLSENDSTTDTSTCFPLFCKKNSQKDALSSFSQIGCL